MSKQAFHIPKFNWHAIAGLFGAILLPVIIYTSGNPAVIQKVAAAIVPTNLAKTATISDQVGVTTKPAVKTPAVPSEATLAANGWIYDFKNIKDGTLPSSSWNIESGNTISDYNAEAQTYTSRTDNVRVEDGTLVIEAKPENINGKTYSSAMINTKDKFSFTYGTIEVTMKTPAGNGTWPAAWLLPEKNIYNAADYGINTSDPFAWAINGEIDFAESIGSIPNQNIPAAHSYNQLQTGTIYTPATVPNQSTEFHTYGVIKTPTSLTFTLDGVAYATRTKTSTNAASWPYDQPYYLIINLAIGGSWAGAQGIDDTSAPWLLQVQSIHYTPLQS